MVNFKIYDVTDWTTNNRNTYITQYLRGNRKQTMKFRQLIETNMRNIFLEKLYTKFGGEASPRLFYKKSIFSLSLDQQSEML